MEKQPYINATEKQALAAFEEFVSKNHHRIRSDAIPYLLGKQMISQLPQVERRLGDLHMVDPAKAEIRIHLNTAIGLLATKLIEVRCCLEIASGSIRYNGSDQVFVTLYYLKKESREKMGRLIRELADRWDGEYFWQVTRPSAPLVSTWTNSE